MKQQKKKYEKPKVKKNEPLRGITFATAAAEAPFEGEVAFIG